MGGLRQGARPRRLPAVHGRDERAATGAALAGEDWREAWQRAGRLDRAVAAALARGAARRARTGDRARSGPAYDRIAAATMLVGGWADGYRNNTFRTVEALAACWGSAPAAARPVGARRDEHALPGPRIDLVPEMVRWWDRWLRGEPTTGSTTSRRSRVFARRSSPPRARPRRGRRRVAQRARLAARPDHRRRPIRSATARLSHAVIPDTGTAAWISCAGHLPWGQPTDQRYDDAAVADLGVAGRRPRDPRARRAWPPGSASTCRSRRSSVRLCDVFPDGRSTLVTRGTLNLTHRDGHEQPEPMPVDEPVDVDGRARSDLVDVRPGPPAPARDRRHRLAEHDRAAGAGDAQPRSRRLRACMLPRVDGPSPSRATVARRQRRRAERAHGRRRGGSSATCCAARPRCVVDHGSTYDEGRCHLHRALHRSRDRQHRDVRAAGGGQQRASPWRGPTRPSAARCA